ncbi:MAG: DUF167 domain-containing protein [Desulfovibrio sp.]|jgi:uncharacterized protein YggU (UPF0235/DUF167 family)|nr:DUF167 domain-containing protein [Desulfovibrio sp.]
MPTQIKSRPDLPPFIRQTGEKEWQILLHILPGAKKSEISGIRDGRLCLRVAAPAVDNKANKALLAFAAELLGIRHSALSIASGTNARRKLLLVAAAEEPDWKLLSS